MPPFPITRTRSNRQIADLCCGWSDIDRQILQEAIDDSMRARNFD